MTSNLQAFQTSLNIAEAEGTREDTHWNKQDLRARRTHMPRAVPKGRKISLLARKVLYLYQNKILSSYF